MISKSDIVEAERALEAAKKRLKEVSIKYRMKPYIIGAAFICLFAIMVVVAP